MAGGEIVLVVDDDPAIRNVIEDYLEREKVRVLTAPDGASMRQVLAENDVDVIVLDVRLPDEDGFRILRDLRTERDTPIILLTGKTEPIDRILGLELGADDYLGKPFELRELLARIRSVLRRSKPAPPTSTSAQKEQVKVFEGWVLDEGHRTLRSPANTEIDLTGAEFELLRTLVNNPRRTISRNELLNTIQSRDWEPHDRTIDVSIARLRKKIEKNPKRPVLIKTIRSGGYFFASSVTSRE